MGYFCECGIWFEDDNDRCDSCNYMVEKEFEEVIETTNELGVGQKIPITSNVSRKKGPIKTVRKKKE